MPLDPGVRNVFDGPYMGHLATINIDGSPQVTPVSVIVDGDQLLVNCLASTVKAKNMARDPRVALSVTSTENHWEAAWVQGRVVEITEEGAWDVLDQMSDKYGRKTPRDFTRTRLLFKIEVNRGGSFALPPLPKSDASTHAEA